MIKDIIGLRHELHKNPEISNQEYKTTEFIINQFINLNPDKVIKLGKSGVIFIFYGIEKGETVMFRAELDGLPIKEISDLSYCSKNKNISHSCGHDGHMAILIGLAKEISINRPIKGSVAFLFQPAEEVEQGALKVLNNKKFKEINPDYIFALHNVPGFEKNKILIKEGSFASGSKGMTIKLFGKTTHAAEPQNGINPAIAVSKIIQEFALLRENNSIFKDFILLTFINIQLGEKSFGTSAGYAEINVTLRAFENSDLDLLSNLCEKIISKISADENLKHSIQYNEVFPATTNNPQCVEIIKKSAQQNNLKLIEIEKPFKWSEDFGYFSNEYKTGYFGIGAGINHPQLHNPEYDFPDDILETGIRIFYSIYKNLLNND